MSINNIHYISYILYISCILTTNVLIKHITVNKHKLAS
jgi:hypothetical protein